MYEGQQNVLEKYPDMEVVAEVIGEASTTVAQQAVSNVLPSLPAVDAVLTQGGGDAWGVVQAFQGSGSDMPIVIGDNTAEFLNWWWDQYQETGYETVSVCSAPTIGGAAVWLALNVLEMPEGSVPEKMSLGVIPITVDNLENYLDTKPGTLAAPTFTEDWVVENLIEKYSNN
jgi:ribose transport system substrate-binding protein